MRVGRIECGIDKVKQLRKKTAMSCFLNLLIRIKGGEEAVRLQEAYSALTFDSAKEIELSVTNYLDNLGFCVLDSGYEYLREIIIEGVRESRSRGSVQELYRLCSERRGEEKTERAIAQAVARAIKAASDSGKIMNLNKIFKCKLIEDGYITPSIFIINSINRFKMAKEHGSEIPVSL